MEQEQLPEEQSGQAANGCVNCGRSDILKEYPTPLCPDCRNLYIKYPIPIGVKIFAGVVGALVIFALFTFPQNLSLGLHLERGKLAEKEKRYVTAQQEFKEVLKQIPNYKEAQEHLIIAAFYNQDFRSVFSASDKLNGVNLDDNDLLKRVNYIGDQITEYFPDTSLINVTKPWVDKDDKIPDSVLKKYLSTHNRAIYPLFLYASYLVDDHNYRVCDSLVNLVLEIDNEYIPGLRLLASSKRDQGKWDESINACNRIIGINKEAGFAYASIARTYLKQKKDKEGLDLALKAFNMNKKESYSIATLALAYHFNNQQAKRDELLKNSKELNDSSANDQKQYVLDVISQKEKFRD